MNTNVFKLFKKFLIENGVFYQFFLYSIRREGTIEAALFKLKNINPINWVVCGFDWTRTIEGYIFWYCANNQWTKIVMRDINGQQQQ